MVRNGDEPALVRLVLRADYGDPEHPDEKLREVLVRPLVEILFFLIPHAVSLS